MSVLNLPETDFIIYTSSDNSLVVLNIKFDETYAKELLHSLKAIYFKHMIHNICEVQASDDVNNNN